ncbi:hypothetical protein [Cellulosilyticum sp. I15G10I2]|uniref:hypothetical protein n=1 Tax=Cellulosilyticum sp. I15G10I2 TaxID=1892843 RepID=UPI00085C9C3D|nr:hypothetical protein [Cellulosilyticum sp. I15G10I2]
MSFGSIIFTDKGRILQAKAQAGKQLNFTKLQIGDGQLGGAAIQALNALISPKKNISITTIKTSSSTATVGGILNNSDILTGFYWREVGLFAADPDTGIETLYCYGNAGNLAEYIPAGGGSEILEKRLDIVATIGNATNISAAIDNSLIYLTLTDLDNHSNSGSSHPDIREQISDCLEAVGNISYPVTSVASKTGAVVLSKADVELESLDNVKQMPMRNRGTITQDPNTTVEGLILTNHANTPNTGYYWHIQTYFYGGIDTNSNRVQVAEQYNGGVSMYLRNYFSGVWSGWVRCDNPAVATTAEAQAGTDNIKYMTPALVKAACQKFGGDIVGKTYQFERITMAAVTTEQLIKSYTNAKGGMVRIMSHAHFYLRDIRIVVDGVTVINITSDPTTVFTTDAGYGSSHALDIPFNNNFQFYGRLDTAAAGLRVGLHYYLNP